MENIAILPTKITNAIYEDYTTKIEVNEEVL